MQVAAVCYLRNFSAARAVDMANGIQNWFDKRFLP